MLQHDKPNQISFTIHLDLSKGASNRRKNLDCRNLCLLQRNPTLFCQVHLENFVSKCDVSSTPAVAQRAVQLAVHI